MHIECNVTLNMFSRFSYRLLILNRINSTRKYGLILKPNSKWLSSESKREGIDANKELSAVETQLKKLLTENIESSSASPFTNLIERLITRTWISFNGDKTRKLEIKERKDTTSKAQEIYRLAFDLPGFKTEDIQVILHQNIIYIEARKEEIGNDGAKSWREFSYECPIPSVVHMKEVVASIDSDGLLLIEAPLPQQKITGVTKDQTKDDTSIGYVPKTDSDHKHK